MIKEKQVNIDTIVLFQSNRPQKIFSSFQLKNSYQYLSIYLYLLMVIDISINKISCQPRFLFLIRITYTEGKMCVLIFFTLFGNIYICN